MSPWPISALLSLHISLFSLVIAFFLPRPASCHSRPSYPQHQSVFHFICVVHYAAGLFFFTPPLVCFLFKLLCPLTICFYSHVHDCLHLPSVPIIPLLYPPYIFTFTHILAHFPALCLDSRKTCRVQHVFLSR